MLDRTGAWALDRFQLRRELRSGPGGEVWLARERDGTLVAVKLATDPEAAARLEREARALQRLDHPHVARIVASGPFEDGHCVVVEHVDGATLDKVLRVTTSSPPRVVGWARQLCQALAHCHERGVVHRDVKAANVLLGRDETGRDRLVLIDFGIALVDREGEEPAEDAAFLGSIHTVSPEQVRAEPVDGRADQYALGVLLYRMLTERYPFHSRNPAEVLAAHAGHEPPPLGQHKPQLRLPPGLEAAVMRCLAKAPAVRFGSLSDLDAELAAIEYTPQRDWVRVTGFDLSIAPETSPGVPPAPPVPLAAVGAGIVAFFAAVGLLLALL